MDVLVLSALAVTAAAWAAIELYGARRARRLRREARRRRRWARRDAAAEVARRILGRAR